MITGKSIRRTIKAMASKTHAKRAEKQGLANARRFASMRQPIRDVRESEAQ